MQKLLLLWLQLRWACKNFWIKFSRTYLAAYLDKISDIYILFFANLDEITEISVPDLFIHSNKLICFLFKCTKNYLLQYILIVIYILINCNLLTQINQFPLFSIAARTACNILFRWNARIALNIWMRTKLTAPISFKG